MSPHVSHSQSALYPNVVQNATGACGENEVKRGRIKQAGSENETDSDAEDEPDIAERDGLRIENDEDLPGQLCVFIPSGDHFRETYRLATFRQLPSNCPVGKNEFARSGFYYTGFGDRVRCFSCGILVENWMVGDKPEDERWHKNDCKMQHNCDTSNIPSANRTQRQQDFIQMRNTLNSCAMQCSNTNTLRMSVYELTSGMNMLAVGSDSTQAAAEPPFQLAKIQCMQHERFLLSLNLRKEFDRRKSFTGWPSYPAPLLIGSLSENGFFYLGNLDRTQCFSCSGVLRNWSPDDDVMEQHRKHFPHCRLVREIENRNIPLSIAERRNMNIELQIRFSAPSSTDAIQEPPDPTPEEQRRLALHFPCRDAINFHMRQEEKRLETFDSRWPGHRIRASPEIIAKAGFFFLGQGDRAKCYYCNGGLQNWEENDEPWTEHAKWFPGCEFVIRRKGIEFVRRLKQQHPNLNRPAIRNPVSLDLPDLPNTSELTETIDIPGGPSLNKSCSENRGRLQKRHVTSPRPKGRFEQKRKREAEVLDCNKLSEEEACETLKRLQAVDICRQCQKSQVAVVAVPCGHFALCSECSKNKRQCILCSKKVENFIRVYRS